MSVQSVLIAVQAAVIAIFVHMHFFPEKDLASWLGGGSVGSITTDINDTYDYIIVGSGSAGSVLASRLTENSGVTVLVLEAGASDQNEPMLDVPIAAPRSTGTEFDWQYYTVPQKHALKAAKNQQANWVSGKVLGGSSKLNYMMYTRGHRHDYNSWAANGCEGWSYEDVLPYFKKSESMQDPDLAKLAHHGQDGPMGVVTDRFTSLGDVFVRAGQEMGYKLTDINDGNLEGFGYAQSSVRNGVRSSTSRAFLWPSMRRPNLHVAVKSRVIKVLIEDQKAVGVEYLNNDRVKTVRARKEVILSAGAVGSPHILMHSGIGPRKHLEDNKIPVHMDLPVGRNLQNHIMVLLRIFTEKNLSITPDKTESVWTWLQYLVLKSGYMSATGSEATGFLRPSPSVAVPDIQILMLVLMLNPGAMQTLFNLDNKVIQETRWQSGDGFVVLPMLLRPKSIGTIWLRSPNPLDYPLIDPKYLSVQEDVTILLRGIRTIQKLLKTKPYQDIGAKLEDAPLSICAHLKYDTDEYWECYIRGLAVTAWHASGTCKMGASDDREAVVDSKLRVKGIAGLRVVDASVMPNIISATTNAPTIMIAEKAADMIKKAL